MKNGQLAAGLLLAGLFTGAAHGERTILSGCSRDGHVAKLFADIGGTVTDGGKAIPVEDVLRDAFAVTASMLDDNLLVNPEGENMVRELADQAMAGKTVSAGAYWRNFHAVIYVRDCPVNTI